MNNRKTDRPESDDHANLELDRAWSDLSDELPSMAADSAILTKAREEVSVTRRRGFLPVSWIVPVGGALAAGLVLGVSLGTFKQHPGASEQIVSMSPAPVAEIPRARSIAPTSEDRQESLAEALSTQREDELEQALVKPLERSIPRAPAAQAAVAPSAGVVNSFSGAGINSGATMLRQARKVDAKAKDSVAAAASSSKTSEVYAFNDSTQSTPALAATTTQVPTSQGAGNSKEAISDTLSEMLDEISDANGELDDQELDLFFTTEQSWLISIQRLLTNQNEKRALQLANKFQQRYPDAEIPANLQSLFGRL